MSPPEDRRFDELPRARFIFKREENRGTLLCEEKRVADGKGALRLMRGGEGDE